MTTIDRSQALTERAAWVVDLAVGENVDRLATLDMRGDGVLRIIYETARSKQGEPLTLAAARALHQRLQERQRVLVLTGFLSPKPYPETDGLTGSAVLAAALERACGALPVFVCEPAVVAALAAALRGAGLNVAPDLDAAPGVPHAAVVIPFQGDRASARARAATLARTIAPAACIAVERPGANEKGEYHYAMGKNVTAEIAPLDFLYQDVASAGALTVGVGDFGNELGMGTVYDVVRAETPAGATCGCGCGGGTACPTPADVTVTTSTSDWGAYGIAACLSYLTHDPAVLISGAAYRRVMDGAVAAGAIDGPTRYAVPFVDGIDDAFNSRLIETMRDVVRYPTRATTHSPIRLFRAARLSEGG